MKLASYVHDGKASYGAVTDQGAVDLGRRLGSQYSDQRALLAGGGQDEARRAVAGAAPDFQWAQLHPLPVIPNPAKIICLGLNYEEHVVETGREKTENPVLFARFSDSQVGADQPMLRPRESTHFDYEAEIAVIIGKAGRRITEQDSWSHVAGYSCYNDGSIRDWQRHTVQWTAGKNFKRTGAFGPWMVTVDEIPPGTVMPLTGRLNGREVQRATNEQMIFKIPALIRYISTFTTVLPGNVVEIEIDKVGVLRNTIADD